MRHFGDDGAEAFADGNAAPFAGWQRRAPSGHGGRFLERRLEAWLLVQHRPAELERVLAGRVRHLVDERLLEEAVL